MERPQPLVASAVSGGRSTAIAFGQTASGKTYTVTALSLIAGREMFAAAEEMAGEMFVSIFENSGNRCFDLLANRAELQVLVDEEERCHVHGVPRVRVASIAELEAHLSKGASLRDTAPTGNNPHSSRSHALCILEIASGSTAGSLTLVDLAGSERRQHSKHHTAQRVKEMKDINWSLGCLKEAIRDTFVQRTLDPSRKVKFRATKLTLLLKHVFEPRP